MWCFVDESWHEGNGEHVGILAAAIGSKADFDELGRILFRIRKKYFGEEHSRNLHHELKGANLFSNFSFKQQDLGFSKNLTVAREVLEWVATSRIRFCGITIYGDAKPPLLSPEVKALAVPFRELCVRILAHVPENQNGLLIFDQRLGAQEDISIAVHNYLAGISGSQRLVPHPLIGVSNVWPGLQLADIAAHVLGRYAINDKRFEFYYRKLKASQVGGQDHKGRPVYGFARFQWAGDQTYQPRSSRTKK